MASETRHLLDVGSGSEARRIAVKTLPGKAPGLIWLGGFRSDMEGTKAQAMVEWANKNGFAATRFDYSGHGESSGNFIDGSISRWLEESLAVFEKFTKGPQVLLGSSMGGWIALRMVQELAKRGTKPAGLVLVAPAPDFTSALMEPEFGDAERAALEEKGFIEEPSAYSDEPDIITRKLIEDGRDNIVLEGIIETGCPVRILQGMKDEDVPYEHALRLVNHLPQDDVTITLINDGDHRLSREPDIELLKRALADMVM